MSTGPLADREWRIVPEERHPGAVQMALEEVAAETAAGGGPRTLRVYRWEPSTLSLGYHQDPVTVDWAFCEREEVDVTRRQTGGGGIYHDSHGDISYSIVAPAGELPGNLMDCYELLCTPLFDALSRMGVDAAFAASERPTLHDPSCYLRGIHPAHDVLAYDESENHESPDAGKKISGNAQYRRRDAVIQHGSLSYALRPERHLGAFADPGIGDEAFRRRVTSLRAQVGISRETAVETLEAALSEWADADVGGWTDEELARARDIAEQKYDSDRWVREREDPL